MEYTDGSMKFKVRRFGDDGGGGLLPGAIIAFSGSFSDDGYPLNKGKPDKDWHLCDGTNGTPDLRGRFILGASASHAVGTTGGEETHTLTEGELPSRTVLMMQNSSGGNINQYDINLPKQENVSSGSWTHTNLLDAKLYGLINFDAGQSHNNMPPYYTLAFIMKL